MYIVVTWAASCSGMGRSLIQDLVGQRGQVGKAASDMQECVWTSRVFLCFWRAELFCKVLLPFSFYRITGNCYQFLAIRLANLARQLEDIHNHKKVFGGSSYVNFLQHNAEATIWAKFLRKGRGISRRLKVKGQLLYFSISIHAFLWITQSTFCCILIVLPITHRNLQAWQQLALFTFKGMCKR